MLCILCSGETQITSLSGDALMRSCQIEVVDVGQQDTIKLLFMEDQHMVQTLLSSAAPPNIYCSRPNKCDSLHTVCRISKLVGLSSKLLGLGEQQETSKSIPLVSYHSCWGYISAIITVFGTSLNNLMHYYHSYWDQNKIHDEDVKQI